MRASSAVRGHISQGITRLVENRVRVCYRSIISNFQEPALVVPSWLKLLLRKIIAKHLQKNRCQDESIVIYQSFKYESHWLGKGCFHFHLWSSCCTPVDRHVATTTSMYRHRSWRHATGNTTRPGQSWRFYRASWTLPGWQGIHVASYIFWHRENNGNSPRSEWNKKRTNPRICWMNTSWAPFYARIWSFDRFADLWGACAECGFCWIYFHWVSQSW